VSWTGASGWVASARAGRRSYSASRPDRLVSGWSLFSQPTRETQRRDVPGLIRHARHAAQNFDLARHYEMLARRHVIGPQGIRLRMEVMDAPDRPDEVANRLIEEAWARWGRRGVPTVCGRLSWWQLQCIAVTNLVREGNALFRMHREGRRPFGFQLEALPFDLLDTTAQGPTRAGTVIEAGIEYDARDRVVAYHLWSRPPHSGLSGRPARKMRVPAAEIIHLFLPEEIGQALGIPRPATALRMMNLSARYQEAALAAAHYGAANMLFFTQEDGAGAAPRKPAGDVPLDDMEAGTISMLPPGVKPEPHRPHYPEQAIDPFMRQMNNATAAGLGISTETLTTSLKDANFSVLRAGKSEERDEWRMMQRGVEEGLCQPVFDAWLPRALLTGEIGLPFERIGKFRAARWDARGWESVNPKDDAMAIERELAAGVTSRQRWAARRGQDWQDIARELREEAAALDGLPGVPVRPETLEEASGAEQ